MTHSLRNITKYYENLKEVLNQSQREFVSQLSQEQID